MKAELQATYICHLTCHCSKALQYSSSGCKHADLTMQP